jgi:hypothetical protein
MGDELVLAPRPRQRQPEVQPLRICGIADAVEDLGRYRLTPPQRRPLPGDEFERRAVLHPPGGDLGNQRRRDPARDEMPVGDRRHEAIWNHQITGAQAWHDTFGESGEIECPLGRQGCEGQLPLLDQWSQGVVLDDLQVVAPGDRGNRGAPLGAHHDRGRADRVRQQIDCLGIAVLAGALERVGQHAVGIHGKPAQLQPEIAGERHQGMMADLLCQHGRAGWDRGHQGNGHGGGRAVGEVNIARFD